MKILALQWPISDYTDIAGPITDFPRFADWASRRDAFAIEFFQLATAPNPLLEDGLENKRIKHEQPSTEKMLDSDSLRDGSRDRRLVFVIASVGAELGVAAFE